MNCLPPWDSDALFEEVQGSLQSAAYRLMSNERAGHTIQATALVNEAYLKVIGDVEKLADSQDTDELNSRMIGLCVTAMKNILASYARRRATLRRGGDRERVMIDGYVEELESSSIFDGSIEIALKGLEELRQIDARAAVAVECRFLLGMNTGQTQEVLGLAQAETKRCVRRGREFIGSYVSEALA